MTDTFHDLKNWVRIDDVKMGMEGAEGKIRLGNGGYGAGKGKLKVLGCGKLDFF